MCQVHVTVAYLLDSGDDLSCKACLDGVWLNKAQGCVDTKVALAHARLLEEEVDLSGCSVRCIRTMACVLGSISPKLRPQGLRRLRSGLVRVGGPNE